jgi:NodT family efflux transporter outer membrane factor (OMF) lipoprotein
MNKTMKNTIYKIVLAAAAVFILGSCGLYTKYERPDVSFSDSLYRRISTATDTTTIATLKWNDLFTDPILQNWIRVGIENNTDLNVARKRIDVARAGLISAKWALLPGASGSISGGTTGAVSIELDASWEADIFGKLRNAKKNAVAAIEESIAYKQATQSLLVATIAGYYYNLLMLDQKLKTSRHTMDNWEENIRTMEALKRAGKTTEAAVLQAKANKLKIEASVYSLEQTIFEVENEMSALLGIIPIKITRSSLESQVFPEELSQGVPVQLLANRPDIRQAENVLIQKFYLTNSARAAFYPNLSLSGTLGWTNGSGAMVVNPAGLIAGVVGSLTQPIFSKGANTARLKTAQAEQEIALYNFRQAILDAGVNVNDALMKWQTAQKRLEVNKKQVVHLKAAVWNTKLLMKRGSTNYLEVLTAQQHLLDAELTAITDTYDKIIGIISLYRSLGGGYDPVEDTPTETPKKKKQK